MSSRVLVVDVAPPRRSRAQLVAAWCALSTSLALGCLQTQDLGKEHATADSAPAPDPTFTLLPQPYDVSACPATEVQTGSTCTQATPVQCTYRHMELSNGNCARSCLCGYDGKWTCIDTKCAPTRQRFCQDNAPCLGDAVCFIGCESTDAPCTRCECKGEILVCKAKVPQ
jgi:hypothetical protein